MADAATVHRVIGSDKKMAENTVYNEKPMPTRLERWAARVNQISNVLAGFVVGFNLALVLVARVDSQCLNNSKTYALTIGAPIVMVVIHSCLVIMAGVLSWKSRH